MRVKTQKHTCSADNHGIDCRYGACQVVLWGKNSSSKAHAVRRRHPKYTEADVSRTLGGYGAAGGTVAAQVLYTHLQRIRRVPLAVNNSERLTIRSSKNNCIYVSNTSLSFKVILRNIIHLGTKQRHIVRDLQRTRWMHRRAHGRAVEGAHPRCRRLRVRKHETRLVP